MRWLSSCMQAMAILCTTSQESPPIHAGTLLLTVTWMLLWHALHGPNMLMITDLWLQVLDVLIEYHDDGLLHLDIKLANIVAFASSVQPSHSDLDLIDWGCGRMGLGCQLLPPCPPSRLEPLPIVKLPADQGVGTEGALVSSS